MTSKVAKPRRATKSRRFPKGNPNVPEGNPISPVMQKVKASLRHQKKPARALSDLTDQPLSICQKLLSGHRTENAAMQTALFQTWLIYDLILGSTIGATDPDVRAVRQAVKVLKLEREIKRIKAGDDE